MRALYPLMLRCSSNDVSNIPWHYIDRSADMLPGPFSDANQISPAVRYRLH